MLKIVQNAELFSNVAHTSLREEIGQVPQEDEIQKSGDQAAS